MHKALSAALLLSLASPALAQQAPASPGAAPGAIPGITATTSNPNLSVSAVRLERGQRLSQVIGASVFLDSGERIGSVDDLVMVEGDTVQVAIVAVGGFIGLGSKLVAVPYQGLQHDKDRLVLPGLTKQSIEAMPNFQY